MLNSSKISSHGISNLSRGDLWELAFLDRLTNAYTLNAWYMFKPEYEHKQIYVYVAGVDWMQRFNSLYGREKGDVRLQRIVEELQAIGAVYRVGGDVFYILRKEPAYKPINIPEVSYGFIDKPESMSMDEAIALAEWAMHKTKSMLKQQERRRVLELESKHTDQDSDSSG